MDIAGKVVVGTGVASGIRAARMIGRAPAANVIAATEREFGAADLLCSNIGIATEMGGSTPLRYRNARGR